MLTVYTTIIGPYDNLLEPPARQPNTQYVCFTDQDIESDTWEIRKVEPKMVYKERILSPRRQSRYYKLPPHRFFEGPTLYVDANIVLRGLPPDCTGHGMKLFSHPRKCNIYKEAILAGPRGDEGDINHCGRQSDAYTLLGMPLEAPLFAGAIIYREPTTQQFMFDEAWWRFYSTGSARDQLPLNFLIWALNYPIRRFDYTLFKSPWHKWPLNHK